MKAVYFPRWKEILDRSDLAPRTKDSHQITLRWYLSWCANRGVSATSDWAREFVEWATRDKSPSQWCLDRWKEAIRWFFINGAGLRVSELVHLRIKDVDLERGQVVVRFGKGGRHRQESNHSCPASFIRNPSARSGGGYSHCSGASWSCAFGNDTDLSSRHAEARSR